MSHGANAPYTTSEDYNMSAQLANIESRPEVCFEEEFLPRNVKWAFITRNVPTEEVASVGLINKHRPQAGDLVLARVERVGQHTRIQLRSGRRSLLYPEDHIIVAYGNRYAPDQFEAEIPADLERCHLVAAGGVAAKAISRHSSIKSATTIRPEGLCLDAHGKPMNLKNYALPRTLISAQKKPVIAVLGTSMNSGKTTTATALVKGLTTAGAKVTAIKATGTGAGNDLWMYADAGAYRILDFTDVGHPSTYKLSPETIRECFDRLVSVAQSDQDSDFIIVEVADGLLFEETAALVRSSSFKTRTDHVLFAAGEAMGAVSGVQVLEQMDIEVAGISGALSAAELSITEAEAATGLPVLTKSALEQPSIHKMFA